MEQPQKTMMLGSRVICIYWGYHLDREYSKDINLVTPLPRLALPLSTFSLAGKNYPLEKSFRTV